MVWTLALLAAPINDASGRDAVLEGRQNWLFAGWENLKEANPSAERSSIGLISDLSRLLAQRQIKLIVVIVPLKPRYYETLLPDGVTLSEAIQKRYDSQLVELRAAGVTALDLREALKTVVTAKKEVFYRADFHWTTFAAEAAADDVAASLVADGPLPGKAGSGMPLGEWITDRHLGDLAANFLPPERKRAIGPDAYVIRKPVDAAAGLLDTEPAPVAVVGNSFVQPYFGFPQRLSNKIDRPVSLKWNPGDIGPWATMLQYLRGAEFQNHAPVFIVWQFNEAQIQNGPDARGEWAAQGIALPSEWRAEIANAVER